MLRLNVTPTIKVLLAANFIISIVQMFSDQYLGLPFTETFGFIPAAVLQWKVWQFVTYAFLHVGISHLLMNLLALLFFAGDIEILWGRSRFLKYYFFCAVGGSFCYFMAAGFMGGNFIWVPLVGASASIFGVLLAFGILYSDRQILFFGIFPIKAMHLVAGWIILELLNTVFSGPDRALSAVAHLGGIVFGFIYLWMATTFKKIQKARLLAADAAAEKKRKNSHLKLVINKNGEDDDEGGNPNTWH